MSFPEAKEKAELCQVYVRKMYPSTFGDVFICEIKPMENDDEYDVIASWGGEFAPTFADSIDVLFPKLGIRMPSKSSVD